MRWPVRSGSPPRSSCAGRSRRRRHRFAASCGRSRLAAKHPWLGDRPGPTVPVQRAPEPPPIVEELTEREREVLGLLADLLNTEEIAAALFVSVNTVRTHVRSILRKLRDQEERGDPPRPGAADPAHRTHSRRDHPLRMRTDPAMRTMLETSPL